MAACAAGSHHRSPSATISSADPMLSSRQLPDETESPFSVFPSEEDHASRSDGSRLAAETENSFLVFPSEDGVPLSLPTELAVVSADFRSENEPVETLPSRNEQWAPAVVSVVRTRARSFSASRVYWWPLLVAAAGMFAMVAVERVSMPWNSSTGARSAATSNAAATVQGPRVPLPLPGPPNPAAAAAKIVPSAADNGGSVSIAPRPAETLAPARSASLSNLARGPAAPITLTPPAAPVTGNGNDLAPEAANTPSSAPEILRPVIEAHVPESSPAATVADVMPVPAAPLATAPVSLDVDASDRAAIDRVLGTYQQSYSSLDAVMVSTIWRGLDTRGLQRAFNGLDSQRMSFEHCDVHVRVDTAKASCTGVLDYVRKIGQANPLQKRLSWNFDLLRTGDRWLISGVDAR